MVYTVSLILFGAFLGMAGLQGWFLYCWKRLSKETQDAIILAILSDKDRSYNQAFNQLKAEDGEEKAVPDGWSEIIA